MFFCWWVATKFFHFQVEHATTCKFSLLSCCFFLLTYQKTKFLQRRCYVSCKQGSEFPSLDTHTHTCTRTRHTLAIFGSLRSCLDVDFSFEMLFPFSLMHVSYAWCMFPNMITCGILNFSILCVFFFTQLIECPSIYELMANPDFSWNCHPLVQVWREIHDGSGSSGTLLESYQLTESLPLMKEALLGNMVSITFFLFVKFPMYFVWLCASAFLIWLDTCTVQNYLTLLQP